MKLLALTILLIHSWNAFAMCRPQQKNYFLMQVHHCRAEVVVPPELRGNSRNPFVEGALVEGKILESRLAPDLEDYPHFQSRTALEVGIHRSVFVWGNPNRICTMEPLEKVHFVTKNPCCDTGPDTSACAAPTLDVVPISVDGSWSLHEEDSSE